MRTENEGEALGAWGCKHSLRELVKSRRNFTRANNLAIPTYEKLDRVLMSSQWEQKFLLYSVFDHSPLLLNTNSYLCNGQQSFKIELGRLLRNGFVDMVKEIWSNVVEDNTPIESWRANIRCLRQHLRGWTKHTSGIYKKEKELLDKLDLLDKKAESILLTQEELNIRNYCRNRLSCLLREEEVKWYQ